MKNLLLLIILYSTSHAFAQRPDVSARCKEEMSKLSYFVGDWKGEASIRNQSGVTTITQTEHIEWKLDGLVLSIEGIGHEQDKVTFHAMALVNFDVIDQQFKLKSFVKEGFSTNAYFKLLEANKYEWGFDIPTGGKSRYTIALDLEKKTWHEIGEYSRDGSQWFQFIEMNLTKL